MGRLLSAAVLLLLAALPSTASAAELSAGVGEADASWHVGSGAGQHASAGSFVDQHGFDPGVHSYHFARSYGVQSRLKVRAIVVEGPDGKRVAIVKNDLYIPQDLLYRRTAQLLEAGDSGITRETLTMSVTHNHSSPYYSTPSWGVWTFQDFFDVRFFNYYAERMVAAVEEAASKLVPVRVGGAVRRLADVHRNVPGRATADDGTPAGYPESYGDHDLTVVRFDDISDPANPKPLANLVNYAIHPEGLEGNDIISADWVGPFERMTDRASGAMTIYTQGAVGNHEPEQSKWHQPSERREYYRRDYAQGERLARELADATLAASADIASGDAAVPFQTGSEVGMVDRWFPGPLSHPVPTVAGCRTDTQLAGKPRIPVANECTGDSNVESPFDPGVSTDDLQDAGVPVPENLSVPAYTGLEEDVNVHLQAIRIGDILITVCPCEQWADQSLNIKSRTNPAQGDEYYGYVWDCVPNGDTITQEECDRMRAQVLNDAKGWDDPEYALEAESEPTDPSQIKGNYTHGELPQDLSYRLTVPLSMANDYNGYIVTYREYQRGDHYRKSLNAWGPHASDYMATRLVAMGGQLKGGAAPPKELHEDAKVTPDLAHNDARAEALGTTGKAALENYEATLAPDRAAGTVVEQPEPEPIKRFDAATFTWNGGSNYVDLPEVTVERKVGPNEWQTYADQSGEVPVTLKFPALEGAATYLTGQRWEWTAHFEVFVSDIDTGRGRATAPGTYRFVVNGVYRDEGGRQPYSVVSDEFDVVPWDGITVEDLRVEPDRTVSFAVGPRTEVGPIDYPNSYDAPRKAAFIREERVEMRDAAPNEDRVTYFCFTCSFRPWLDAGDAARATVTIVRANGQTRTVPASLRAGRWVTAYRLRGPEAAFVAPGAVVDAWGNFNGAETARVGG